MKIRRSLQLLASLSLALCALSRSQAQVLAAWDFEGLSTSGVNASPSTSSGTGTASTVGMALFTGPDASGISKLAGTDGTDDSSNNLTWKVRGGNGWNTAAAIGTQGAQFSASTAGYQGITASFDWYPSTKGEANLLIQYTTNGTTWVDAPSADIQIAPVSGLSLLTNNGSDSNTVTGAYLNTSSGNTWYNTITLSLTGVAAANNDSSFGIRLVNASTGVDDVQASGGALDNTSGNWSFDDIKISAQSAIPEPASCAAMIAAAALGLALAARNRRGLTHLAAGN